MIEGNCGIVHERITPLMTLLTLLELAEELNINHWELTTLISQQDVDYHYFRGRVFVSIDTVFEAVFKKFWEDYTSVPFPLAEKMISFYGDLVTNQNDPDARQRLQQVIDLLQWEDPKLLDSL